MFESASENGYSCALCERQVSYVTLHHLIPKEEGGRYGKRIPLCQPCHVTLHSLFTNKELKKEFHSVESLRKAERLQNYLAWIRTKKIERISNKGRKG
jgi:5-methylcytosine-specific restriction endonuclease McrA